MSLFILASITQVYMLVAADWNGIFSLPLRMAVPRIVLLIVPAVALAVALLTACALATPWIHTTGVVLLGVLGFVLLPVFAAMVQRAVNELIDTSQAPVAAT